MKTIFKPARIAFYLLMLFTFCLLGLYLAAYLEAGKNQGLAGGAIVLSYGVVSGGIAFIASFFVAHMLAPKVLNWINWILLLVLLLLIGSTYIRYTNRDKKENTEERQDKIPTEVVPTASRIQLKGTYYTHDVYTA